MGKTTRNNLKKGGNENSYTQKFFESLFKKIDLKEGHAKANLKQSVILAAQAYMSTYNEHQIQKASHEVEKELKKALNHIDKAAESLIKVYASGGYGSEIVNNLHNVILEKYPSLQSALKEILRGGTTPVAITSPLKSIDLLASMGDAVERTVENFQPRKTTPKSFALSRWLLILSAQLEPIIGRKLEQSRYYKEGNKGEYISKRKISDSELLFFIINPLDPNVTISQIETAIKETRGERHNAPWVNYFPNG